MYFSIKFNKNRVLGCIWGVLAGVVEAKIAARAKGTRSNFCDTPLGAPRPPHGGIGGVLVIGYWLLVVPTVRFERPVPRVRFHPVALLGSRLGS